MPCEVDIEHPISIRQLARYHDDLHQPDIATPDRGTLFLSAAGCGPKDADIATAATQALAAVPGATVSVANGVATISGQVFDSAARNAAEAAVTSVKGVKSVVNNATVTPPAPVVISADDSLKTNVAAALKDFPTLTAAKASGASNLAVRAQDNVLYIDGVGPSGEAKDKLWSVYEKIDPDFRGGDLVLNLDVSPAAPGTKLKVTTQSCNLNIRKGSGTDQPIIGKTAHLSEVTLLSKYNSEWALVRSANGDEGYCSLKYLTQT